MNTPSLGFKSIFFIIFLVISSWLLIHALSLFGIFLAVAYPTWWLFSPKQITCFFCRSKKEGEICPFCRQVVVKSEGVIPKTFSSAILNGSLIFLLSLVSIGVVFLESQLLLKMGFPTTQKTVSFVIPAEKQYRLGEIFPIKIEITGIEQSINAVQADLGFNPAKLEVVNITTNDSFADIFIQKEINNDTGYARLTGGIPNPGYFSNSGKGIFGTVYFRGKTPGLARIRYLPSSLVLVNNGHGDNVLKEFVAVSYLILPEKISDEEDQLQKDIISKINVLGASTAGTKMIFYDQGGVPGAKTKQELQKENKVDLIYPLLDNLQKIDTFILMKFGKLLSL